MKRLITLFALVSIVLTLFVGYQLFRGPNALYQETLSDELKTDIRYRILMDCDDLIYWDRDDPYYGTINGCIIVRAIPYKQMFFPEDHGHIEIAGYNFETPKPIGLYAYRDDEACELKEAYEKGWLTKKHIEKIYKKHNEIYADWVKALEEMNNN